MTNCFNVQKDIEADVIGEALDRSRKEEKAKQELAEGKLATEVFRKYGIL